MSHFQGQKLESNHVSSACFEVFCAAVAWEQQMRSHKYSVSRLVFSCCDDIP